MTGMSDDELEAIRRRAQAATPGPWVWDNPCAEPFQMRRLLAIFSTFRDRGTHVGINVILEPSLCGSVDAIEKVDAYIAPDEDDEQGPDNLEFIASARTDVERLLAEIDRLRGMLGARAAPVAGGPTSAAAQPAPQA